MTPGAKRPSNGEQDVRPQPDISEARKAGDSDERHNEQKRKRLTHEERVAKDVERFKQNLAIPRPGFQNVDMRLSRPEREVFVKRGLELSDLQYIRPQELKPNPLNDYPPLAEDEMAELRTDIGSKGVLVPLIARVDNVLLCGHNRLAAALALELERVPVQRILGTLTPELEKDIMKSENDRRRGGKWSREKKEQFILEHFGEQLAKDKRGGDHTSVAAKEQKFNESLLSDTQNIAVAIEKKSRGRIARGTAQRLVTKLRKQKGLGKKPVRKAKTPPAFFKEMVGLLHDFEKLVRIQEVADIRLALRYLADVDKRLRKVVREG